MMSIFLPIIVSAIMQISACIDPTLGCSPNQAQAITLFEDGSARINDVGACIYPAWGCSQNEGGHVIAFEDGSVIITWH